MTNETNRICDEIIPSKACRYDMSNATKNICQRNDWKATCAESAGTVHSAKQ